MINNNKLNLISITNKELKDIRKIIYDNFGIDLTEKKKLLIETRLSNLLRARSFKSFTEYIDYINLYQSPSDILELIDIISTNHTYFFREEEHFNFLSNFVFKEILEACNKNRESEVRIWSAGCSSGDEAYSIAMLASEFFNLKEINLKILASDISISMLREAKIGIYNFERIKKVPMYLREKYFTYNNKENLWHINEEIKKLIQFKKLNLMNANFPFTKKFHLIFCRNVMIYFDEIKRSFLVNNFYRNLYHNSYLFIGHSENIRNNKNFKFIKTAIYKTI